MRPTKNLAFALLVAAGLGGLTVASSAGSAGALQTVVATKGDRLGGCAGQVWPAVDAACLATANGAPERRLRTVTIGYRNGEDTTVLVRIPAPSALN
jgi:hypothetical protein